MSEPNTMTAIELAPKIDAGTPCVTLPAGAGDDRLFSLDAWVAARLD